MKVKNILEYMQKIPHKTQDTLYTHPATCLAVYRSLSPTSQQYIMRLLFLGQPVPLNSLTTWVKNPRDKENLDATRQLKSLRLWSVHKMEDDQDGVLIHGNFKKGLTTALCGGGMPWYGKTEDIEVEKNPKSVEFLIKYSRERWECVLQFMVGGNFTSDNVSPEIAELLLSSGLISKPESDNEHSITSAGFQFLLLDTPAQIWYFMIKYLDKAEANGLNLTTCIAFIFQLSFSTLGKAYPIGPHNTFVQHLRQIGLVYQRKHTSPWFYPTKNGINFITSGAANKAAEGKEGFIIVETNFRIYAYTTNELDIALVALFSEPLYRFSNFLVGHITRESVQMALRNGITARQVIDFLQTHAHPQIANNKPIIPSVITDQMFLWEMERQRLSTEEGVLYSQFITDNDFNIVNDYAHEIGCVLWSNKPKRLLVVSKKGHGDVKKYWKKYKQEYGDD